VPSRIRISLALLTSLAVLATTAATTAAARRSPARPGGARLQASRARDRRPGWVQHASVLEPHGEVSWGAQAMDGLAALGSPTGFGAALVGSAPVGDGPAIDALDPSTHTLYVTNGLNINGPNATGNTVSVIDTRHCRAHDVSRCRGPWPTIRVGNLPSGIAIDERTHTVYVSNSGDNTVSVFDAATCNAIDTSGCGQTPATVPVGAGPQVLFDDPANHTLYVPNFDSAAGASTTVSMINTSTCNAIDLGGCPTTAPPTVDAGSPPEYVDSDQATHTIYVTTLTGWSVFDADTCNAAVQSGCGTIGMLAGDPSGPNAGAVDPANDTLYTANYDNTISAFDLRRCNASDLAGCAQDAPGTVTPFPESGFEHDLYVAVDVPLHSVYVTYQKDDAVLVVDTNVCNARHLSACKTLIPAAVHTGADPEGVVLDPTTQTLYPVDEVDNSVSVIDAARCSAQTTSGCRHLAPTVPVPGAGGVAVDAATNTAYVTSGEKSVAMLNTDHCNADNSTGCASTPPTVKVGDHPNAVSVDEGTHTVYVANFGAGATGTVSVFDDRTCNATRSAGCASLATLQVPGGNPDDIAVNAATDTVYVATITSSGPDLLSVFNGDTCNAASTVGCNQTPATAAVGSSGDAPGNSSLNLAVNRETNTIYLSNVFNTANGEPPPFLGNTVYVLNGAICDAANTSGCSHTPATVTIAANPPVGSNPSGIAVDQTTNTIYTANIADGEHPGTASVINGATCNGQNTSGCDQTPAAAPAGFGAVGIAVDPATHDVYTTNTQDASVSMISGSTCNGLNTPACGQTPQKVAVGDYPGSIAIDPAANTAYVQTIEGVSVMPLSH
jgi:YVTN family beta-propeller protein